MNSFGLLLEKKPLVLGTALWGWGVSRKNAYRLLDKFFASGGHIVDTATNYPINKCDRDFGLSIKWISDWVAVNGASRLSLIVKVGSIDNMGGSIVDLSSDSILRETNKLRNQFKEALSCISIHWDDRRGGEEDQLKAIEETIKTMEVLDKSGCAIGMSGIRRPDLYFKLSPELCGKWVIQVKENISTHSAREAYQMFFPQARYLVYGINMGGLKIKSQSQRGRVVEKDSSLMLRGIHIPTSIELKVSGLLASNKGFSPRPRSLNELALASSYVNPSITGVIIGPRTIEQLNETLAFWDELKLSANSFKDFELFNLSK